MVAFLNTLMSIVFAIALPLVCIAAILLFIRVVAWLLSSPMTKFHLIACLLGIGFLMYYLSTIGGFAYPLA